VRLPRQYCHDDGCRIAYVVQGRGPAVLLLHGLGGTADFWQPLIAALATHYTLIAPDLLGFGFSDKPADICYTPARHAQAVDAVLQAQAARGLFAVIGHSCGGVIAAQLIAAGHMCTDRLVLAAVPYPSPHFPVREELLNSPLDRLMLAWNPLAHLVHTALALSWPLLHHLAVPPHLQGAWAGYMEHTIPSYVGTAEECLFRADLDPVIPLLQPMSALLLYSEVDQTVPLVHGERLHAALPHSQLQLILGGHYAILQQGIAPLVAWLSDGNDRGGAPAA
jgi:pimeloyl-ACP methyl ester carboxylesterase